MSLSKLALVVGARPNFIKAAPLLRELEHVRHQQVSLVHTGQHSDPVMSTGFLKEFDLRGPDENLGAKGASPDALIEDIAIRFENWLRKHETVERVIVIGDVSSTLASTFAARRSGVPVSHVEAGLRSGDLAMPEERHRIQVDKLSDQLFCTEPSAVENLREEGYPEHRIHLVGNVLIDALRFMEPKLNEETIQTLPTVLPNHYILVTLHRPANVDVPGWLEECLSLLNETAATLPVVFPVHPRTRKAIEALGEFRKHPDLRLLEPLRYKQFLFLAKQARAVLTDSGGVQEETTAFGVPCLTLRDNTERPITVTHGTNQLVGRSIPAARIALESLLKLAPRTKACPPLWDGKAAARIADVLLRPNP